MYVNNWKEKNSYEAPQSLHPASVKGDGLLPTTSEKPITHKLPTSPFSALNYPQNHPQKSSEKS
jgi:hypothetical protein